VTTCGKTVSDFSKTLTVFSKALTVFPPPSTDWGRAGINSALICMRARSARGKTKIAFTFHTSPV